MLFGHFKNGLGHFGVVNHMEFKMRITQRIILSRVNIFNYLFAETFPDLHFEYKFELSFES